MQILTTRLPRIWALLLTMPLCRPYYEKFQLFESVSSAFQITSRRCVERLWYFCIPEISLIHLDLLENNCVCFSSKCDKRVSLLNSKKFIWSIPVGYVKGALGLIFRVTEQLLQELRSSPGQKQNQRRRNWRTTRREMHGTSKSPPYQGKVFALYLMYSSLFPRTLLQKLYEFFENYS